MGELENWNTFGEWSLPFLNIGQIQFVNNSVMGKLHECNVWKKNITIKD